MKLAVMQPYFFPYLGYFQLIGAVDTFVCYDDVAFIKKGWINRNFILMACRATRFTVPLAGASQHRAICDTRVAAGAWADRFLKTLRHAYGRAPQFAAVEPLAAAVVTPPCESIGELALRSILAVMRHLGLGTRVRPTSRIYGNAALKGAARILDICAREGCGTYVNAPGGRALYDPGEFAARGIELRFLEPGVAHYRQLDCAFVPNLSILDVLMFNDPATVRAMIADGALSP